MITVIVPAYKEPAIGLFHERLVEAMNYFWDYRIVYCVGDVGTWSVVSDKQRDAQEKYGTRRNIVIIYEQARGLGRGVKTGIEYAVAAGDSDYIVTIEADGSNDPEDIRWLVFASMGGIAIAKKVNDARPLKKIIMSMVYKFVLRTRYGLDRGDYNHLFRCVKSDVAKAVVPFMKYHGYEGVPEFVVRAKQVGFWQIREVPSVYRKREAGESKLTLRKAFSMARLLVR